MRRELSGWLRVTALTASACCCFLSQANAHAPNARKVALTPDAAAIAVSMPGFGVLERTEASGSFAYICDALLDDEPTDIVPSLLFLNDRSLLMGTIDGVRIVAPDSCPSQSQAGELSRAFVVALAAQPGAAQKTQVVYAAVAGDKAGLWRSSDSARSWTLQSPLTGAQRVTGLFVSPSDPNLIYLSQDTSQGHSWLLFSDDGGVTFDSVDQERALTLLHVPDASSMRFWALAPSADNLTNRGYDLLYADALQGPWTFVQRVNYFGGFTIEPAGALWLGDEGGGLYRSDDGGDSFVNLAPRQTVACLAYAGNALWACTPGTNLQPALSTASDAGSLLSGVVTLASVDHLVACSAEVDVPRRCAAAWLEWRRDVRMEDLSQLDAGHASADGGGDRTQADAQAARDPDACLARDASSDASQPASPRMPHSEGGCSAASHVSRRETNQSWFVLALLLLACARHARQARPPALSDRSL